jgi:uncharacterized protein (TIGR02466 family)
MPTELLQAFVTPVWVTQYPDFAKHKKKFLSCVNSIRKKDKEGVTISNVNGYQSQDNLTQYPQLTPLFDYVIHEVVRRAVDDLKFKPCNGVVTSAWVNFNDSRNAVNTLHSHGDTFSGVFYLQAPENSGRLLLLNEAYNPLWEGIHLTEQINQYNAKVLNINPVEGELFLWCSHVPHFVLPNNHDKTRISISFNVKCFIDDQLQRQDEESVTDTNENEVK